MTLLEKYRMNPVQEHQVKGVKDYPYKITSDQLVGIEVEVENITTNSTRVNPVWRTEGDGSLRNNGIEFITYPIKASSAPAVLNHLMTDVLGADCHFSPRTSVHVHLNVQDLTVAQVVDLVMVYSVYERLFFKFAGRGRIRNIFCVPITETTLLQTMAERGLPATWSKYTALNLAPIRGNRDGVGAYGTIEFRHMHGTARVEKLAIWIDLIVTLKEFIMKSSTKDIRVTLESMHDDFDFDTYLKTIFGEKAGHLRYEKFADVEHSYLAAKSAVSSTKIGSRLRNAFSSASPFFKFKG